MRTADYTMKKSCGIYELKSEKGRILYKIFVDGKDLQLYLKKNKMKICEKWLLFLLLKNIENMLIHK